MAQQKDGVFTWLHSDHLPSATVLIDADGLDIAAWPPEEAVNSGSSGGTISNQRTFQANFPLDIFGKFW